MRILLIMGYGFLLVLGGAFTAWADKAMDELHLWRLAAKEQEIFEQHAVIIREPSLTAYLNDISQRLWRQTASDLPPMTIKVIQDSAPNGFAYPNGIGYVTTGMLTAIADEDQLAFVLAHEIIHYVRQHALSAYGRLHMPLDHHQTRMAVDPETVRAWVARAERQADREGVQLIQRAGYCAHRALKVLTRASLPGQQTNDGFKTAMHAVMVRQGHPADDEGVIASAQYPGCDLAADISSGYSAAIAPAYLSNAKIAAVKGALRQARESILIYLKLFPQSPEAHFTHGEILRRSSFSEGLPMALDAYRQALRLDSRFAPAHRALGLLCYKAGNLSEAGYYFESFLALNTGGTDHPHIRAYLKRCRP